KQRQRRELASPLKPPWSASAALPKPLTPFAATKQRQRRERAPLQLSRNPSRRSGRLRSGRLAKKTPSGVACCYGCGALLHTGEEGSPGHVEPATYDLVEAWELL
uniref:Uncharacterized protein n=1 Tax=Aegilops tauschii subsp. strangulata TaxID=200361 RepID=A0A453E237_AEGTS